MPSEKDRVGVADQGLGELLARLRIAWNAGDAPGYAHLFTDDATYVIWRGELLTGRSAILHAHHHLFTNSPTTLHIRTVDTRLLDDHTAVLVTIAATTDKSQPRYDKLQTLIIVRREHGWKVAALHNTAMSNQSR